MILSKKKEIGGTAVGNLSICDTGFPGLCVRSVTAGAGMGLVCSYTAFHLPAPRPQPRSVETLCGVAMGPVRSMDSLPYSRNIALHRTFSPGR